MAELDLDNPNDVSLFSRLSSSQRSQLACVYGYDIKTTLDEMGRLEGAWFRLFESGRFSEVDRYFFTTLYNRLEEHLIFLGYYD